MRNFVIIGVGGYIAPRHIRAIYEVNSKILAGLDRDSNPGILHEFFPEAPVFDDLALLTEYLYKLEYSGIKPDFASICSPNYMHPGHAIWALKLGLNVICEKPVVLSLEQFELLEHISGRSQKSIYPLLQLRAHPEVLELKRIVSSSTEIYKVNVSYITPRDQEYYNTWKGDLKKSGGIGFNIGIHLIDMLVWIFGNPIKIELDEFDPLKKIEAKLFLERAEVNWLLSTDRADLPTSYKSSYRVITVNDKTLDLSRGLRELHTVVYRSILAGTWFNLNSMKVTISLLEEIYRLGGCEVQRACKS